MRRTLLFCTLFVFGFFSSVVSQDAPAGPGTRVRVWTEVNEKGPRTTGRVAAWNSDSLILNPVGAGNRRSIPVTSVSRMDVSRGQWSMGMGALRGGGAGFLIGGVSGVALVYLSPEDGFGTRQDWAPVVGSFLGGIGAVIGALIGASRPGERWERVPLPGRVSISPSGRTSVAVFTGLQF